MVDEDDFNAEPYYITKLKEIAETEIYFLEINCTHLQEFDKKLYRQLIDYPTDVIPIFDLVATQVLQEYSVTD